MYGVANGLASVLVSYMEYFSYQTLKDLYAHRDRSGEDFFHSLRLSTQPFNILSFATILTSFLLY